jgi:hypothetical protein
VQIDSAPVRAVANDLEDGLSEVSAEAREAITRSLEDGRELLVTTSGELREVLGDRAGAWGGLARERAGDLAAEVGGELEQRAGALRAVVRSRARDLEQDLPVDADDAWAYAQMGGWHLVRGMIAVVAFIPRVVVRVLGALSRIVDGLAGVDVPARGRELAAAVPFAAGTRPVSRRRTVFLLAVGGVIGFVAGVAASRRRAPIVTYDVPPAGTFADPLDAGAEPTGAADAAATDGDTDGA